MRKVELLLIIAASTRLLSAQTSVTPTSLVTYLQLSNDQLTAISAIQQEYNDWAAQKSQRAAQVQQEIVEQTGKSPLDPMELGVRYAELEAICRDAKDHLRDVNTRIVAALNDAQKSKLKALDDAISLQPVISQAQIGNILPFPGVSSYLSLPPNLLGVFKFASSSSGGLWSVPFPFLP